MQSLTIETVTETVETLGLRFWVSRDSTSVLVPFSPTEDHGGYDVIFEVSGNVLVTRVIPNDLDGLTAADPGAVLALCNLWNSTHRWPTAVFQPMPRPSVRGDISQHFVVVPPPEQVAAAVELPLATGGSFVQFLSGIVRRGGLGFDEEDLASLLEVDDAA